MKMRKIWSMSTYRLLILVVLVVIPLNMLTLILSDMTVRDIERQVYADSRNALKLYMEQIDIAIERVTKRMHMLALNDVNFSRLNSKKITGKEEYYNQLQSIVNLRREMTDILLDHSFIVGIYTIFPEKNFNLVESRNTYYLPYKQQLVDYVYQAISRDTGTVHKWEVVSMGDSQLLLVIANYKNAYYGAWVDLAGLAEELNFKDENMLGMLCFTDEKGKIYYGNNRNLNMEIVDEDKYADQYICIGEESRYAYLKLYEVFPKSEISKELPLLIRILQVASFGALIILPVILVFMKKWMIRPMNWLVHAMEEIEAGNIDFRIEEKETGNEFEQINHNFNNMMEQVSNLKIDIYEEKLEKQRIRMRFLSQQIQPHFILNTLNILYSYEPEEYELIQKMILCLSKYFRYIINANTDFVAIQEEMEHIRNYLEIQQVRYPKTFFSMVEYEEIIADCLIPPLLIQNFAENAIKHSIRIGNKIDIFVIAQKYKENFIRIRIMDTGEGIEEALIKKVNCFMETGLEQEGLGVGIQNAVERLNMLYGEDKIFKITREKPCGTRIEIVLPLWKKDAGTIDMEE